MNIKKIDCMKKVLLSITSIALVALTAQAQDPEMRFGAKAGMNYTMVNYSSDEGEVPDSENGIGWHVGAYVEKNFNDLIGVRPELVLSSRGIQETVDGPDGNFDASANFLFLEIPVLLNFTISPNFSVHVGPQFDIFMSQSVKIDGEKDNDLSTTDGKNTFLFGAAIGVFYELGMGLNFSLRYVNDFTQTNAEDKLGIGYKEKMGVGQVSVGYTIVKK